MQAWIYDIDIRASVSYKNQSGNLMRLGDIIYCFDYLQSSISFFPPLLLKVVLGLKCRMRAFRICNKNSLSWYWGLGSEGIWMIHDHILVMHYKGHAKKCLWSLRCCWTLLIKWVPQGLLSSWRSTTTTWNAFRKRNPGSSYMVLLESWMTIIFWEDLFEQRLVWC